MGLISEGGYIIYTCCIYKVIYNLLYIYSSNMCIWASPKHTSTSLSLLDYVSYFCYVRILISWVELMKIKFVRLAIIFVPNA